MAWRWTQPGRTTAFASEVQAQPAEDFFRLDARPLLAPLWRENPGFTLQQVVSCWPAQCTPTIPHTMMATPMIVVTKESCQNIFTSASKAMEHNTMEISRNSSALS